MSQLVEVLPIGPEDREKVMAAAAGDGHDCLVATHWLRKNDEVVGAWNLGGIPLVMNWQHTEKVGPRESLYLQGVQDALMRERGVKAYLSVCEKSSPYHPLMERLGYKLYMGGGDVFVKSM